MVCYPQFQSRRGHPPLVNSQLIDEILSYDGQGGLRKLLRDHEEQAISVPVGDPFIRLDADTPQDLKLIREEYALYAPLHWDRWGKKDR
jgi:CTP:molybdopterin cytidylyltransferase MocA